MKNLLIDYKNFEISGLMFREENFAILKFLSLLHFLIYFLIYVYLLRNNYININSLKKNLMLEVEKETFDYIKILFRNFLMSCNKLCTNILKFLSLE